MKDGRIFIFNGNFEHIIMGERFALTALSYKQRYYLLLKNYKWVLLIETQFSKIKITPTLLISAKKRQCNNRQDNTTRQLFNTRKYCYLKTKQNLILSHNKQW